MVRFTNTCWVFIDYIQHMNPLFSSLAAGLSAKEMVIVVEQPISIIRSAQIPSFRARCHWKDSAKRLGHYRPLHFPEGIPGIRKLTQSLNFYLLKKELDRLLPPHSFRIVFYGCPTHYRFAGRLGEGIKVYYAQDDRTLKVTGEPIPGEELAEKKLLGRVDGVICVSATLAERLRRRAPDLHRLSIHVLPNGYDDRFFDSAHIRPEPAFLKQIPHPRILIPGHISERIDWDGITEACQMRPSWNWIFLGPADPGIPGKINRQLRGHGHYFPAVPVHEVSAWIQHCEASAAPYRLNAFTLTSDPLKVIESLAMGAPVLATRIPSLARYQGVIEWVEEGDGASYARALDLCEKKDESGTKARQKAVRGDTWQIRAEQLRALIRDWENPNRCDSSIGCAFKDSAHQGFSSRDRELSLNR